MSEPEPRLLTAAEAVKILRLDAGRKRPDEALRHLRRTRRLGYVKIGRRILYRPEDIERCIEASRVEPLAAVRHRHSS